MTLREIQTALRCIAMRRNERSKFEAALHGMQLKTPEIEHTDPDPAREAYMEAAMKRLVQERVRQAHGG